MIFGCNNKSIKYLKRLHLVTHEYNNINGLHYIMSEIHKIEGSAYVDTLYRKSSKELSEFGL